MHIFLNIALMLIIIYSFNIIGQIINNKYFNRKFKYSIPLGFALVMATFQVFSFPFMLIQTSFSTFLLSLPIYIILWIVLIVKNKQYFSIKVKLAKEIICLLLIVMLIIIGKSIIYSDSWLYSAMITSTIENNLIFSHNGLQAFVKLDLMHHRFDSYYLLQATIAFLFSGNYLIALISEYKILDCVLIVFTFLELGYQFGFGKKRNIGFAFALFMMLIAQGYFLDLSPFQTTEPPIQLFQLSTGTALFHYFIIPYMIIYLRLEIRLTEKQRAFYLVIFLLAFSSLTTTYFYTYPLYLITLFIITHMITRKHARAVLIALLATINLIVISGLGVSHYSIINCLLVVIIGGLLSIILYKIYDNLSLATVQVMTGLGVFLYMMTLAITFSPQIYGSLKFTTDKQALRLYNTFTNMSNGQLNEVILPLTFLIFSVIILMYLVINKKFRFYANYMLTYCFLFLNPLAMNVYKEIGIEPVISRIYAFSFIGYMIIICGFYLYKNVLVGFLIAMWTLLATAQVIFEYPNGVTSRQDQIRAIKNNIDGLANYQYADNSFIVFDNLNATVGSEVYLASINKLVVLNPKLSWDPTIQSCDQLNASDANYTHCYTIYKKASAPKIEYVYETNKYLVAQDY